MKMMKLIPVLGAASLAFGAVCFDYSIGDPGSGTMTSDGSWYQLETSAVVEARHADNNWYPVGKALDIADCPTGDSAQPGTSDCFYGWNDADMMGPDGVSVRVTLSEYVNPTSWGYTNGGLLYILNGTQTATATPVNIGTELTIKAKLGAGKAVKVMLSDGNFDPADANSGIQKASVTGTGSMQTITLDASAFSTWASNVLDMTTVKGVFLQYEIGATTQGGAFPGQFQEEMVWQSLEVNGSCGNGSAIGDKVAAKSVGFAALRGGLQFSNIPSGAVLNVQMFNTLGKVVSSHKVTSKSSFVSTEGLNNGVYVVRATDGAKLNMMRNVTIMK